MRLWAALAAFVVLLASGMAACSSDSSGSSSNPAAPGGSSTGTTCSSVGVLGSARGTINATVNGATFTGGIPNGNATYTPLPPGPFQPAAMDFFVINGVCGDGSQINISARAGSFQNGVFLLGAPGTTQIGVDASGNPFRDPQTQQPLGQHFVNYTLVQNGAAAGGWATSIAGGTGSITLTAVSSRAVSGSFTLTMAATAGTAATGTRQVNGTFSATFP